VFLHRRKVQDRNLLNGPLAIGCASSLTNLFASA
jgi:hypothetical protein